MNNDLDQTGINTLCSLHHLPLKEVTAWNDAWDVFLSENVESLVPDITGPQDISRIAMKADVGSSLFEGAVSPD